MIDQEFFISSLRTNRVELGEAHELDTVINAYMSKDPKATQAFVLSFLADENADIEARQNLVALLGRVDSSRVKEWMYEVGKAALNDPNKDTRSVAIDMLDQLATRESMNILERHVEPEKYLSDYLKVVIKNLAEQVAEKAKKEDDEESSEKMTARTVRFK